jgi:peptidase, M16 family
VQAGRDAKVEAYVDNVKSEPLVPTLPKAGRIVKTTKAPFGYTQWTLSNGARVFFKKTDFNDAQILMTADSWGGSYKFADKDVLNGKLVQTVMSSTGLGNFTATELEKKLAGKQVSLAPDLGKYTEGLSGSSTPKDLRTLFELVYLYFQKPANDPDAYHNVMASLRTQLENADKNPQKAFADSVRSTIYDPNPRIEPLKISDLDKVSYDEIKRLYSERFYNAAGDFDFYFTGALNEDSLRTFCEQYIAPLPAVKKREKYTDLGIRPRKGMLFNRFERQLETPQAMLVQVWNGEQPYNLKDAVAADAFGQVLTKRYLKSIREDHGMAYSVGADASLDYGVRNTYSMQVFAPFTPEKCDSVLLLMKEGLHELAKNGVRPDELEEVKRFEIKQYEEQQRNNNYWQALIVQKNMWNKDDHTGYLEAIKSLTSADVQRFANKVLLRDGNCATIIMLPKGTKQAK